MGCELVSSSLPQSGGRANNSAPISYTEQFYENLPYYLSIGMTWDEYWNDDCLKAKYYRKADKLRRKQRNQELSGSRGNETREIQSRSVVTGNVHL